MSAYKYYGNVRESKEILLLFNMLWYVDLVQWYWILSKVRYFQMAKEKAWGNNVAVIFCCVVLKGDSFTWDTYF